MMLRTLKQIPFVCLAAGALAVAGCGDEEAPPPPAPAAAPAAPEAPAPAAAAAPKAAATAVAATAPTAVSAPVEYTFDVSLRDPFEPVNPQAHAVESNVDCGPLCNFDLAQFRITGIIWGISQPAAMLRGPDGKPYIVKVGMNIGRNKGKVVSITKDRIAVLEKYVNYRGEVVTNRVDIELQVEGGIR